MAVPYMKAPKGIFKNKTIDVIRHPIPSYDGEKIECLLFFPKAIKGKSPCLIYIHGGGFVLPAADYHYKNAVRYATDVGCKVVFVNYRLAPKHPHPIFFEDCYAAMCWAYDNADALGIDRNRIGIGGDSAGSTLSVGVCLMAQKTMGGINGYGISSYSEHKDWALKFVEFATSAEMVQIRAEMLGIVPARGDVIENIDNPATEITYNNLDDGTLVVMPSISAVKQIWTPISSGFKQIATDGCTDRKLTLSDLQAILETIDDNIYKAIHTFSE